VGCASIWGFDDLTLGDGGGAYDATTAPDAAAATDGHDDVAAPPPDGASVDTLPAADAPPDGPFLPDANACTSVATVQNCTACGKRCDTANSVGASCSGTTCMYTGCAPGYVDCDKTPPDTNGCETPIGTVSGCGVCGAPGCDTTHSFGGTCSGSTCTYTGCLAGWDDCNKVPPDTDGCETQLNTPANCGACQRACDTSHSFGAACVSTNSGTTWTCHYLGCSAGWSDCSTNAPDTDGCETHGPCGGPTDAGGDTGTGGPDAGGGTDAAAEASACTFACSTANGTPACTSAGCTYTCASGWGDCNPQPPDLTGCTTPLSTVSNCAGCGNQCDGSRSIGATCDGTTCQYTGCQPGWANCNTTAPDTNGCETSLTATTSCGGCTNVCSTSNATSVGCDGTTCTYTCATGWGDCNQQAPDLAGCTTSFTSTLTCGGCQNACDTTTGTPSCNGTTCSYTCKPGYGDCNAATPPDLDGCETALDTSANCGACGTTCPMCTAHSNGRGQTFYDCTKANTYNQAEAQAACAAYGQGTCTNVTSSCEGGSESAVCECGAGFLAPGTCWAYAGQNKGMVYSVTGALGVCSPCNASSSLAPWN
jgi:hypothetical protein